MTEINWTPSQRAAIDTVDRSVLVSAGAGSGKTAVLAERCAHLVADHRPPCAVDQILVVTFTDAAASEMRERIARTLRARLTARPEDPWLAGQLALVDSADISTLHSFCRRLLGRYFAHADLDPQMPMMDPSDASLLRRETAQQVFDSFEAREDAVGESYLNLLAAYSGGSERTLINLVLEVDEFLTSILDPDEWIRTTLASAQPEGNNALPDVWRMRFADALREELQAQLRTLDHYRHKLAEKTPLVDGFIQALDQYAEQLKRWSSILAADTSPVALDQVCAAELPAYEFPTLPRKSKKITQLPSEEVLDFEAAGDLVRMVRDNLFRNDLLKRFGHFSVADWAQGLTLVRPHMVVFLQLVRELRAAYQRAKSELGVMDFADLERRTVELLQNEENGVAAWLREHYQHVLVDEFQDTSPLQAEILRLVSREIDPARKANLFTVGDVKQSIYRFRLAEPRLFLERMHRFEVESANANPAARGCAIHLVENFRSRPRLLEAINAIFERLMVKDLGDIDYDEAARLKPGRNEENDAQESIPPIELHILDDLRSGAKDQHDDASTSVEGVDPASDESKDATKDSPEDWQRMEREAYVMADCVQKCLDRGYALHDIAILLRSMKARSALLMRTLARRGISARSDVSGGFFEALEVRDMLCLLALLDNEQQDIPLAAVLRSPILGSPLSDSDLVEVRTCRSLSAIGMPFHAAFREYAIRGPDETLRTRLRTIRERLSDWRRRIRSRTLADTLWEIYEQSGYFAYVSGLREGPQRRANLIRLHEYARQFGTFRRQGLYRFLQFMDALLESGDDLEPGVVRGGAENVVRVMSIHRSKGLEFPVVIVGELGKRFNLKDARRSVLFDRQLGLALEAVDVDRRIRYPTLPHRLVARSIVNESLSEDLRVLYVAMTRARERLILVGTQAHSRVEQWQRRLAGHVGPLPLTDRRSATGMLDWVTQAICCQPRERVAFDAPPGGPQTLIHVHSYAADDMKNWSIDRPPRAGEQERLERYAAFAPLELKSPQPTAMDWITTIEKRLTAPYRAAPLTRVPAVAAASLLKRRWESQQDDLDPAAGLDAPTSLGVTADGYRFDPPRSCSGIQPVDAAQRGTWTHEFLQRLDLRRVGSNDLLRAQREEMIRAEVFRRDEADQIDLDTIAWLFQSPLGQRLTNARCRVFREWPFVIGVDPTRYDPGASPLDKQDLMLVRGIIDVLFDDGSGWEILDYKTDQVSGTALAQRADLYRGQLRIYAAAVEATLREPVRKLHLAFLSPREIIEF